jgi:hypothetical protein
MDVIFTFAKVQVSQMSKKITNSGFGTDIDTIKGNKNYTRLFSGIAARYLITQKV